MRTIDTIVVHCSATPPSMDIGTAEIRRWHVDERGWRDIGYHYVIRRNGQVETGRPLQNAGAHCKGHNANSVGVCLVGGTDAAGKAQANFTYEQYCGLMSLLDMLQLGRIGFADSLQIVGHRDLNPHKDCPCFDVKNFLQYQKEVMTDDAA